VPVESVIPGKRYTQESRMQHVQCPKCGKSQDVPEAQVNSGSDIQCGQCGSSFHKDPNAPADGNQMVLRQQGQSDR
jgi:uncharacterized paraquat-inducible protein A